MLDPFSSVLNGLQKFGDDITKSIKDAQSLVEDAVKRGEAMQPKPQLQRTWEQKRDGYHRMGMNTPLGGNDENVSLAPSVSPAPSVSSTSSERSAQSESGDSARSNTSERSSQSSLIRVLSKLMGRDTDAPLNQAPSPFDSKNPEKNNNKESSNRFSAMFTSLGIAAISFFKNLSKEEGAKQEKTSSTEEPQKRVEQKPQPQQPSNGDGIRGLWKKLIPDGVSGVFVQAEDKNTGQAVRLELPFALPKTGFNRNQVELPTVKEMQKSAVKFGSSIKANAVSTGGALAGAYGVAKEGFTTQNIKDNIGGVASVFASGSPSGSPRASMAQSLKSGAKWLSSSSPGSESMATTFGSFVSAVSSGRGSSASYGSGRYTSGVSFSAGLLSR